MGRAALESRRTNPIDPQASVGYAGMGTRWIREPIQPSRSAADRSRQNEVGGPIYGANATRGPDLSDRGRRHDEAEPHGWDRLGVVLGRLAARLDEQHTASLCVPLPAA